MLTKVIFIKKIIISLLIISIAEIQICFAQNDWRPGYIIKTQTDTIYGVIDNRDSKSNSEKCYFRKEPGAKTVIYTPQDMYGYRFINGIYFVSKNIGSPDSARTVFLQFLIEGKVNVYHYKDKEDHYFVEKDSTFYELKNSAVVKKINNQYYLDEKKEYMRTLSYLLKDADIQPDIQKSTFDARSLVNIAREYHEKVCNDEQCIEYTWSRKSVSILKGFYAGIIVNKLNFGKITPSDYSVASQFGFRFEFTNIILWAENLDFTLDLAIRSFNRYTLHAEKDVYTFITYNNVDYNLTTYQGYWMTESVKSLNVNIKTVALCIPVSIIYRFSKGNTSPYAGLGIQNMITISQNKNFTYQRFYDEFNKSIPTYNIGLIIKSGSNFKLKNYHSIFTELSFESTQNLNINRGRKLTNNMFSIIAGYNF